MLLLFAAVIVPADGYGARCPAYVGWTPAGTFHALNSDESPFKGSRNASQHASSQHASSQHASSQHASSQLPRSTFPRSTLPSLGGVLCELDHNEIAQLKGGLPRW